MSSVGKGLEGLRYRRPLYVLAIILLAAVVGTAIAVQAVRSRIAADTAQTNSLQQFRLQHLSLRVDAFMGDAAQLAYATATGPCSVRGDRALIRRLLSGLLSARMQTNIYGLGCFFEPREFDGRAAYYGPYVHVANSSLFFLPNTTGYRYTSLPWYRAAVEHHGALFDVGPYLDDGTYFYSFVKAFYSGGRLAGVVSVDAPEATMKRLTRPDPGDFVYFVRDGRRVLASGTPLPEGTPVADLAFPLRYARGTMHLVSGRGDLLAQNERTAALGGLAVATIWLVALLMSWILMRSWRARAETFTLQVEQVRLENEIRLRDEIESRLRKAAYTDALTGLPNRAFAHESLTGMFSEPGPAKCLITLVDVDDFSLINDTLGHESGDKLLKAIATRLRETLVPALVTRFGGDEFLIIARADQTEVPRYARAVKEALSAPFAVEGQTMRVSASLGIVDAASGYTNAGDALKDAEIAMYRSKRESRGGAILFSAKMRREVEIGAELAHDLRRAIGAREFVVYYQPIVKFDTRAIVSLEALVRWDRPGHGLTLPADFIPYAEAHGLVSSIDALVMQQVCADMRQLLEASPEITVAVNCSMAQLTSTDLVAFTVDALSAARVDSSRLRLEITETSIMRNAEYALQSLERLRSMGILSSVDDFGTGYSSLAYLQRLPIAGLKIDRSFITPIEESAQAEAIVRSIVALADTLGLYAVAEGVETAGQTAILERLGASHGQGFFFCPPVGLQAVLTVLRDGYREAAS